MRIAHADVFYVADYYILIKLTSTDGAVGWGEAHPMAGLRTVRAAVELTGVLCEMENVSFEQVSQDLVSQMLYRGAHRTGFSVPDMCALSGIDIALHDLVARTFQVPVWLLLGGKVRDRVPMYISFMHHADEEGFDYVDEITKYHNQGVRAIKLHTGSPRAQDDRVENTMSLVRAVRDVWPTRDELGVMVDVNCTYTGHGAIRVGRMLEELDVWWLEEPIATWDRAGYRHLHDMLRVPIAAGENEFLLQDFREIIVDAQVDIVQPNLLKCGGFRNAMKIAALAEAFNKPIACNNWCNNRETTLMTAAQMQFWAAAKMCVLPQEFREDEPLRSVPALVEGVEMRDGFACISDKPGLGVLLDEERIQAEGARPYQYTE